MSTGTQTTKTASDIKSDDIIRIASRKRPVEVIATWAGRNGTIEIAGWDNGKVALILKADELVTVAA